VTSLGNPLKKRKIIIVLRKRKKNDSLPKGDRLITRSRERNVNSLRKKNYFEKREQAHGGAGGNWTTGVLCEAILPEPPPSVRQKIANERPTHGWRSREKSQGASGKKSCSAKDLKYPKQREDLMIRLPTWRRSKNLHKGIAGPSESAGIP